jgi:membrane-associated phospholipid phosphatase
MDVRNLARATAVAGAAVAVGAWTSSGRGRDLDGEAFRALNRHRGAGADAFFTGVTELGSILASAGAATVLAVSGRPRAAVKAFAAAGTAWLVGQGLKKVFLRPRPYTSDPDRTRLMIGAPRATSWPSSHPAVFIAFATAAGRELGVGAPTRAALGALGLAVGASRTYVGVHYPADVVGGILVGRAVGELFAEPNAPNARD